MIEEGVASSKGKELAKVSRNLDGHYEHCAERALNRHGFNLDRAAWERLNQRVKLEENVEFLFQPNKITSIYKLEYEGHKIGVMFSEVIDAVTSLLPPEDVRLQGTRPDGSKPTGNHVSRERAERLRRAGLSEG